MTGSVPIFARSRLSQIRRLTVMVLLGFASGLPLALVGSAMQAWLTTQGIDLVTLGFLALVGVPYTFKFLWAPLIDRFDLPFFGRRRGWIVALQIVIAILLMVMSQLSPVTQLSWFVIFATGIAFASASLDLVIDAYRTDLLELTEQALGSSMAVLGYRLGMVLSGGIALIWAQQWQSWPHVYQVMAVCLFVSGPISIVWMPSVARRQSEILTPLIPELLGFLALVSGAVVGVWGMRSLWSSLTWLPSVDHQGIRFISLFCQMFAGCLAAVVAAKLIGYQTLYQSINDFRRISNAYWFLALVLCYKLGEAFALSLTTPFLIQGLNFSQIEVGLGNKSIGLLMSILGALLGGLLLLKIRLSRALFWFGVLQLVAISGFYGLAYWGKGAFGVFTLPAVHLFIVEVAKPTPMDQLLLLAISLDHFSSGLATAALTSLLSSLSRSQFSASRYALLSAISSLGRVFVGPMAGIAADQFGWSFFFLIAMVICLPGVMLVWWLHERIDAI